MMALRVICRDRLTFGFGGLGGAGRCLGKERLQRGQLVLREHAGWYSGPDVVRLPGQLVPKEGPQLHSWLPGQRRRLWRLYA